MLVISTTFFQLMSVCFVLYTSPVFASPVDFSPVDLAPTRTLERRRPRFGNLCNPPGTWTRRQCVPERGPLVWQDVCKGRYITTPLGYCLPGELCEADIDQDGDRTIKCVPTFKPNEHNLRQKATDPQIGSSESKQAVTGLSPTEFTYDVTILDNLGLSVISAVILSEYLLQILSNWCPSANIM